MKNIHNIQLAIYAALLSLTVFWLLLTIADTAVSAFREWEFRPCVTYTSGRGEITTQPLPLNIEYYPDSNKEEQEDIILSPQNILMPPFTGGGGLGGNDNNDNKNANLIVSDLLVKTPKINVFASLTRDFSPIVSRLNDQSQNTTVLAPLNSAINALPRKPWEDPEDYKEFGEAQAYKGQDGQDRATRNLQRFVEAHLVPVSPWKEGEEVETVGGGKVKWVKEGETVYVSVT